MATNFCISIEENLKAKDAKLLLSDFEEVIGKHSFSLDDSSYEVDAIGFEDEDEEELGNNGEPLPSEMNEDQHDR